MSTLLLSADKLTNSDAIDDTHFIVWHRRMRDRRMPKLLLQREAAELLRCSERTLQRLRAAGKIAYLEGRPIRFDEADILAYLEHKRLAALAKQPDSTARILWRVQMAVLRQRMKALKAQRQD